MYSIFDELLSMLPDDIGRKVQVSIGGWLLAVKPFNMAAPSCLAREEFRLL